MVETALKYFLADFCVNKFFDSISEKFTPFPSTELQVGDQLSELYCTYYNERKRFINVSVVQIFSDRLHLSFGCDSRVDVFDVLSAEWLDIDWKQNTRLRELITESRYAMIAIDHYNVKSFVRK